MAKGFGNNNKNKNKINQYSKENIEFLWAVLQKIHDSNAEPQIVYPFFLANLDKFDEKFQDFLEKWGGLNLPFIEPEITAIKVGMDIMHFSNLIASIPIGNIKIHLEIAITGYRLAALIINSTEFSKVSEGIELLAILQNNFGEVYRKRILGNCAENLEHAINCFKSSLEVLYSKHSLELLTDILNNLGLAYLDRIFGDRRENIEIAINNLKAALSMLDSEIFSEKWAYTKGNLGIAYKDRILGNRSENIELAILCYQDALKIYNLEKFSKQWSDIYHNLGDAYLYRTRGGRTENLELAIKSLETSLQGCTYETFPYDWAETQNNLGTAYLNRLIGDKKENVQLAFNYYQQALRVRTIEALPRKWAETQMNLGYVYYYLENIAESIKSFQNALEIEKLLKDHLAYFRTGRNLGKIAFQLQFWKEAIEGYSAAIEAVETSRSWAKSESRRQEILEESIDIYQNIIQACINAGQIDKAFEYSERSRSKLLVDLMASNHLSQSENIPLKVQELLQQYEELQQLINTERQKHKSENNRSETRAVWQAYNEKIASLEAEKQQTWENLRREDPVLAGEIQVQPLSLSEIQRLIDNQNTAILSFYTTNTDTHIFIVRKDRITLHTCTGEGLEILQQWIYQNWLLTYTSDVKKWESQIEAILRELSQRLQLSELIDQHLQEIEELIIVPHLLLHQVPFAALPIGYQEYLVDKFLIRYTPSCQILDFCYQRPNLEPLDINSLQYGTVEDATDDLQCARFEGENIAQLYNIPIEKRLIGSSQATRENYRQLAEQVQILHSCHHAQSRLDNPLESGLILADGNITLGQLMSPGWRLPNLIDVFLSCCETNLGTPALTDDILTLSTGFLCAGARSVVSSLWSVNDLATAFFSIFYYEQRKLGKSRPESLQQAQIKLRELRKADLDEMCQEAEIQRKKARNERKKYPSDSEEYLECMREYKKYAEISIAIDKFQKAKGEFPFVNPRYWSAFIVHGLR
ncbi:MULTISPECIES: CHAT domain-containing protein [unclassified Anabaena]|uniref:CHAT domain-containing protein n=1 Tax=unclassified Anabaena TaxID=2619674 RepID=UPI001446BB70|nr:MULTISPECIES: CHAT domain-containing protein [unclassified Anabaena]MTJ07862.1 CHAT domain-containing protein [Anabaena sp. UHCC 0204]MTJ51636.1 CHAT domain-containing protein [Anabaena sp. UHCC 0253]